MFRVLRLVLTEGFADLFRYPAVALASVGSAAVTLVLVGAFFVTAINVARLASGVASQVNVRVFVLRAERAPQEAELAKALHDLPGLRQESFISRAEALRQMRQQFSGETAVFAALGRLNPLLDSFSLSFTAPRQAAQAAGQLNKWPGVARVIFPGQAAARLEAILALIKAGGVAVAALLAVSSFLVISNAVRLAVYGRRRELEIMLLVGATRATVRGPFLIEGMLFGLMGGAAAILLTGGGYRAIVSAVFQAAPFVPLVPPSSVFGRLVVILLGGGLLLGYLGSAFALRRLVRVGSDR